MPSAVQVPGLQEIKPLPDLLKGLPKLIPRRRSQHGETSSNPAPITPALPPASDLTNHQYATPTRRILSERDHQLFLSSASHDLIVSFIFRLSDSVHDMPVSAVRASSAASDPAIVSLIAILDEAEALIAQCPPLNTGSRFGNPAFRTYLSALETAHPTWHTQLGITFPSAQEEVSTYLLSAFGSGSRIDYGSGHELNFLLWLLCLRQTGLLPDATFPALTLLIFPRYLRLMRAIQSTYYLEPAGSHGVWGLDDYQFLPFLFGASQLVGHPHLRPRSIHSALVLEECGAEYLYLDQIAWVNATKTVQGLRWHSPMLDDISAAKSWAKVEQGMRKMFLAEVLGKLPVAQHFLFGSLIPADEGMSDDVERRVGESKAGEVEVTVDGMKHRHNPNSWGDCCGIKVPSAVGARMESRKEGGDGGLRRVPFD